MSMKKSLLVLCEFLNPILNHQESDNYAKTFPDLVSFLTFDENILYQRVMDYTKQLADDCNMPNGFIDFILRWNAFKASVETEHYIPAIKFYKMLFDDYSGTGRGTFKPCGCHG